MKAELRYRDAFPHEWRVELLDAPPLIAPARQFTYPVQVAGEEDALARGALLLMVRPGASKTGGGAFLATCALGFKDASMPTEVYACPDPEEICAVAGGYAYVIDAARPERSTHISLRPVVEVRVFEAERLLVFVGFHTMVGWGVDGWAWETRRLSWEGLRAGEVLEGRLRGFGWDLKTDREVAFSVDLLTGECEGGAFRG